MGFAQKHMKFMGIPIDGNVYSFCEKLKERGFIKNPSNNKSIISYKGNYYGEEAFIDVTFDPTNNVVFQVSVSIVKNISLELYPIQRDILKAVEDKYSYKKEVKNPDLYQYVYYVFDNYDPIGLIQTYLLDVNNGGEAMFNISYTDVENYMRYEEKRREDI